MRDHVTEEIISAYVDGELEGDELELVERLLAESVEHRQLLAEFQELRASMHALPSFSLPADFHTRVVNQIDELKATPSHEPVLSTHHDVERSPWRSVFVAAASLAALITFTVMLRPPSPQPSVDTPPGAGVTPVSMPVYFQQVPQYTMVYDVTVTKAGQQTKAVDTLLKKAGIGIDPALRLDSQLERGLMAIRQSPFIQGETDTTLYKNDLATPKSNDQDKVEMLYVVSTVGVLDQFGLELETLRNAGLAVSELHYDIVLEPNKVGVMHRLHDSAREYVSQNSETPSAIGQAFRLAFRFELNSVSVPGAAMFPTPSIRVKPDPADPPRLDVNRDGAIAASDAADVVSQLNANDRDDQVARKPTKWDNDSGHILLIIRNVGANAADPE
ncbi:MAG: hypothetical protein H6822_11000 [Planctomycetaceae bacterium]|nr:hypothetical protein [Planctomycetales bacterium]MCB9922701.1 hypothetical protein [Planctomycetaceae bacterium]